MDWERQSKITEPNLMMPSQQEIFWLDILMDAASHVGKVECLETCCTTSTTSSSGTSWPGQ